MLHLRLAKDETRHEQPQRDGLDVHSFSYRIGFNQYEGNEGINTCLR